MKKIFKNTIIIILFFVLGAGMIKAGTIFFHGYEMYKTALNEVSIEKKIEELQNQENYIEIEEISPEFLKKIVLSEDKRFNKHPGFDILATTRAMASNIKAGSFIQGGSTITQQLAKNLYFSFEKRMERKVAEVLVAFKLEKQYTKEEILEFYCNEIYFGENCYGIEAAANHYYNVEPMNLNEEQIDALVQTIKSPNDSNPNAILASTKKAM